MKTTRKAYLVTLVGWPDLSLIIPAETPGKAKALGYADAHEAGFNWAFVDFRARRIPEFDDLAKKTEGQYPWCLGWKEGGESWGCLSATLV